MEKKATTKHWVWILRIIPAVILLQTLYFKFTAALESVWIFSTLGMEPWGRIGSGILELVASVLLLVPATTGFGALLGAALMGGAVFFHVTKLGVVVQDDNGLLFVYALSVLASSLVLVYLHRLQLIGLVKGSRKNVNTN